MASKHDGEVEDRGKTEWEDILIKHGIMAAPDEQPDEDDLFQDVVDRNAARKGRSDMEKHENKTLEQLDKLEDKIEENSLAALRAKRLAELKAQVSANKFGDVVQISEKDYQKEVTEASKDVDVVVHLFVYSKPECKLVDQALDACAKKFKHVKFLRIQGKDAIRNFPESNCPTLLVYRKGDILQQFLGINSLGGKKCSARTIEWMLSKLSVVKTDMDEDPIVEEMRTVINHKAKAARAYEDHASDDDE